MKYLTKLMVVLSLISSISVFSGCGKSENKGVISDGSTITVGPEFSQTGIADFEVPHDFTIVVRDKDGNPIPNAKVTVQGHYAASPLYTGLYQFFLYSNSESPTNVMVNSPFEVITDDFGTYTFSVLIKVTGFIFTDNIEVRSGTASGSVKLEVSE